METQTIDVNFDGPAAASLFNAMKQAGMAKNPGDDIYAALTLTVHGWSDSKDFMSKTNPCYQKPKVQATISDEHQDNHTISLNSQLSCSGEQNQLANTIYNSLVAAGADVDDAMAGEFELEAQDVACGYWGPKASQPTCYAIVPKYINLPVK